MEYKNIKNYEHYQLFENGKIYNTKTKNYVNGTINKNNQYRINLTLNGITKSFTLSRLIYENFNNIQLEDNEIIKFVDGNDNNFHYKNLEKINRTEMFKVENHQELDKNKEWKIIKDYPDYKISNYGDVFSIKSNKMLKPTKNFHGYFNVKIIVNNNRQSFLVHRLVYEAFKNLKINNNLVIDHIDRNPSNNYIDNLREVSKSENSKNREFPKINMRIQQFSLNNEFIKQWNSPEEIINELKLKNKSNISMCCNGITKSAYGFIWKINDKIYDDNNINNNFKEIITNDDNKYSNYKINNNGIIINKNNKKLKYCIRQGYYETNLTSDDGIKKNFKIHRLVAMTFVNNPNNYDIVNHIDQNKLNNDIKNLEWMNHTQNITHSQGKKVNQIDIDTNKIIKTFDSVNDAFRELNKNYGANIRWVCEGKRKSAFGYKWEFV
jgi:hypothetical protein